MKNVLLVGLLALTSPVIAQDCFEMAGGITILNLIYYG